MAESEVPEFSEPETSETKPDFRAGDRFARTGPTNTGKFSGATRRAAPKQASERVFEAAKKVPSGDFVQPIAAFYTAIGMGVYPKLPSTGQMIVKQAMPAAQAWQALAEENEHVRKALEAFTATSTGFMIFAAHWPILKMGYDEIGALRAEKKERERLEAEAAEAMASGAGEYRDPFEGNTRAA